MLESSRELRICSSKLHSLLRILLGDQFAVGSPDLDLAVLQRQELLLVVQEDEGLRRIEARHLRDFLLPTVVDLQLLVFLFDHDVLVKLFKKFYFVANIVEFDLLELLPGVDVDQRHRDCVVRNVVQQKHYPVANLELRYRLVLQHILQLICR